MTQFAIGGMILAMVAVLAVLAMGLYNMVRGQDIGGVRANKLMWWRVFLQGIALAFFALAFTLLKNNG